MKSRLLFTTIILFIAPGRLMALDAESILRKAQIAERNVSYRGTKAATVHFGKKLATSKIKVVHKKPDNTRTEYFSPNAVSGTIIIRNGCNYWRFYSGSKKWVPINIKNAQSAECLCSKAFQNYKLKILGTDRIADRSVYVIYAMPKFSNEPAYKLWVDRECYLILGTQAITPSGEVISSSKYINVEINPVNMNASLFKVPDADNVQKPTDRISFQVFKPSYLPEGYQLVGASRFMSNKMVCSHLQFSNGANTISMFQRRSGDSIKPPQIDSKVLHVHTWKKDRMLLTLIGNVSSAELQKIAESVH